MLDTRFAGVWNTGFCSLERCKSLLNIWAQKPKKRPSLPLQLWLSACYGYGSYGSCTAVAQSLPDCGPSVFFIIPLGDRHALQQNQQNSLDIHWICRFCQKKTSTCWKPWRKKIKNSWCVCSCLVALIWSAPATVLIFIHLCSFRLSPIFAEFPWISTFQLWGKGSKFWMKAHVWEVQCSCCLASGAMRSLSIGYLYKMVEAKR